MPRVSISLLMCLFVLLTPSFAASAFASVETARAPADPAIDKVFYTDAIYTSETPDSEDPSDLMLSKLRVDVDLFTQEMKVYVKGELAHIWPVSSGRKTYETPEGTWRPYRMHTLWRSRKYDNARMPYAVFFHEGYAIHGTKAVSRLGRPASHGCIRLDTRDAKTLFDLVKTHKRAFTEVNLSGEWNTQAEQAYRLRKAERRHLRRYDREDKAKALAYVRAGERVAGLKTRLTNSFVADARLPGNRLLGNAPEPVEATVVDPRITPNRLAKDKLPKVKIKGTKTPKRKLAKTRIKKPGLVKNKLPGFGGAKTSASRKKVRPKRQVQTSRKQRQRIALRERQRRIEQTRKKRRAALIRKRQKALQRRNELRKKRRAAFVKLFEN